MIFKLIHINIIKFIETLFLLLKIPHLKESLLNALRYVYHQGIVSGRINLRYSLIFVANFVHPVNPEVGMTNEQCIVVSKYLLTCIAKEVPVDTIMLYLTKLGYQMNLGEFIDLLKMFRERLPEEVLIDLGGSISSIMHMIIKLMDMTDAIRTTITQLAADVASKGVSIYNTSSSVSDTSSAISDTASSMSDDVPEEVKNSLLKNLAYAALVLGAIAGCAYGIYKLYHWYNKPVVVSECDPTIIDSDSLHSSYEPFFDMANISILSILIITMLLYLFSIHIHISILAKVLKNKHFYLITATGIILYLYFLPSVYAEGKVENSAKTDAEFWQNVETAVCLGVGIIILLTFMYIKRDHIFGPDFFSPAPAPGAVNPPVNLVPMQPGYYTVSDDSETYSAYESLLDIPFDYSLTMIIIIIVLFLFMVKKIKPVLLQTMIIRQAFQNKVFQFIFKYTKRYRNLLLFLITIIVFGYNDNTAFLEENPDDTTNPNDMKKTMYICYAIYVTCVAIYSFFIMELPPSEPPTV